MQRTGEEVKGAKINGVYSMFFRVYFTKTEIKISKSIVTVTLCMCVATCVWNCVIGLFSPSPTKICHSTPNYTHTQKKDSCLSLTVLVQK